MNCCKKDMLLYGVTDSKWVTQTLSLYRQTELALQGGATFIQIREKHLSHKEFLSLAKEIVLLCKNYNVPVVINDNVEIALQSGADGVHLGQGDMDISAARQILGKDKIIGVTVKTLAQAQKAEKEGADYLGTGAAFNTSTKLDTNVISRQTIKDICSGVNIPVVAIGGITKENANTLKGMGISGIAVVSALFAQNDIKQAAEDLLKISKEITE